MKKFTSIAIAFLLVLSVIPAMAGEQTGSDKEPGQSQAVDQAPVTFQAFNKLSATEREALTPLTDKELAAIEGSGVESDVDVCLYCANIAIIKQTNVSVFSKDVDQVNAAEVRQEIN